MFTLIVYIAGCAVIAGILTILGTLFKPIHKKGDSRPWVGMTILFMLVFASPYAYVEGLTKVHGADLRAAVLDAYSQVDVDGPMQYFRIVGYRTDKEASVYAVGLEKAGWGGTDRPVVAMHLVDTKGVWHADGFKVLYSQRLNKDGFTFPPYW